MDDPKAIVLREVLIDQLLEIWKNENFVLGVMNFLENDEEVQHILDFIEKEEYASPSDITVEALYIAREREETLK